VWAAPGGHTLATFVINLERSPERLRAMGERLDVLGLPWQRIVAVDGPALPAWPPGSVDEAGYARRHGKPVAAGEVGCYLSHLKALRAFLDTGASHLLLLEDDALPGPACRAVVEALLQACERWDLVKLSGFHRGSPAAVMPLVSGHVLAVPFSRQGNTAALMFSRQAAAAALAVLEPMRLPYDHALERPWVFHQRLRIVTPSPVQAQDGSPSTISGGRTRKFGWVQRLPTHAFRVRNESRRLAWALGQWLRR
jgi:glycosyl transferase family 25